MRPWKPTVTLIRMLTARAPAKGAGSCSSVLSLECSGLLYSIRIGGAVIKPVRLRRSAVLVAYLPIGTYRMVSNACLDLRGERLAIFERRRDQPLRPQLSILSSLGQPNQAHRRLGTALDWSTIERVDPDPAGAKTFHRLSRRLLGRRRVTNVPKSIDCRSTIEAELAVYVGGDEAVIFPLSDPSSAKTIFRPCNPPRRSAFGLFIVARGCQRFHRPHWPSARRR